LDKIGTLLRIKKVVNKSQSHCVYILITSFLCLID